MLGPGMKEMARGGKGLPFQGLVRPKIKRSQGPNGTIQIMSGRNQDVKEVDQNQSSKSSW